MSLKLGKWIVIPVVATAAALFTQPAQAAKKHLLVVTHTTGFRHGDSIPVAEGILADIGNRSGVFDVDYARNADDVSKKMTASALMKYDGVIFCQTTGDLGLPDRQAFLDFIRSGHAFIGTHSAADTYHNWPEFIDMIGGEFLTHGPQREVEVFNQDPFHPATDMLPLSFKVTDEIYQYKPEGVSRAKSHVLLAMSHLYPGNPTGPVGDFWNAWCRDYGSGRVFYTGLGHRPDVWRTGWYQAHLLGGIEWALGLVPGSAAPTSNLPGIAPGG